MREQAARDAKAAKEQALSSLPSLCRPSPANPNCETHPIERPSRFAHENGVVSAGKEAEEAQWEAQKRAVVAAESAKTEAFRELLREQALKCPRCLKCLGEHATTRLPPLPHKSA
eukprot:4151416-Pyramimonas_sp.AAC.1